MKKEWIKTKRNKLKIWEIFQIIYNLQLRIQECTFLYLCSKHTLKPDKYICNFSVCPSICTLFKRTGTYYIFSTASRHIRNPRTWTHVLYQVSTLLCCTSYNSRQSVTRTDSQFPGQRKTKDRYMDGQTFGRTKV